MKKKMYLLLLAKRALKLYPTIIAVTLITLLGIALSAVMILKSNDNPDEKQKVSIGIVGDTSDKALGIGVDVIKDIDSSRLYFDFLNMTEDEAKKALEADEIAGYLYIPENFAGSILRMKENVTAQYYLPNKPENLGTVLTREVIDTVSIYITESQRAAAGVHYYVLENELEEDTSPPMTEVSGQIIANALLARNDLYEREYTGIADSLSVGGYYVMGLLLFFMLLWGISCSGIFEKKDLSMTKFLATRGMGACQQIIYEYIVYFLMTFITFLIIFLLLGAAVTGIDTGIPEFKVTTMGDIVMLFFKLTPVMLAISAMQMFMYELVTGTVASTMLQFLSAIVLGYLSGCFYPNYFFPDALRSFIELLPPGAGFAYMRGALLSKFEAGHFFILLAYTLIFIPAAMLLRKRRMAGDGE